MVLKSYPKDLHWRCWWCMLQILRLATPQKSHPDKTPTDPQIEMEYLDKDLISEQVSDLRFGHQKCPFWEWEKATFTAFPHFRKVTSGARNKNLRPVLILALWRGNVVSDLLTFGHWKVVFSLFLILHRAFSHFMYLTFCQLCKRKMVQSWFQKLFCNQDCDVVGNLVVEIENFNFCLFVCLLVCLYLTFCQFRKRKMVQS